ncbi:MAG: ABC transporter permease subunit [Bacillota bacterium]
MIKKSFFNFVITILSLILIFFVLAPIFKLVFGSSPGLLLETVKEKEVYSTILRTFQASLVATFISIILAVPLAYLLARGDFPGKVFIEGIMNLPVIIPHTAAGIALLTVFGNRFFLGKFFSNFNLSFVGEFAGIVVAMMFVSMPFLLNDAVEGFRSIDVRLEKVARSLGASPAQTFFKIALPLNLSHIISGSLMMWARGLSEFGAVVILAYHPMSAPVLIYERFTSFGLKYSRPIAAIMVVASLIVFIVLRLVNEKMNSVENRSEG